MDIMVEVITVMDITVEVIMVMVIMAEAIMGLDVEDVENAHYSLIVYAFKLLIFINLS